MGELAAPLVTSVNVKSELASWVVGMSAVEIFRGLGLMRPLISLFRSFVTPPVYVGAYKLASREALRDIASIRGNYGAALTLLLVISRDETLLNQHFFPCIASF